MKFVTVATKSSGYLETLEASCKRNKIKLDKLGWNMEWRGWRWRTEQLLEYLNKYDEDEIVCMFDGYDVIILGGEEEIRRKFLDMNCDILLSTEVKSHYLYRFISWYQNSGKCKKRYLNGGCYMGYAKALRRLLNESIKYYNWGYTDDQEILTIICKSNYEGISGLVIKYDYASIYYNHVCRTQYLMGIIMNYIFNNDKLCEKFEIKNGRILVGKDRPCIIHFPGNYDIENYLTELKLPVPKREKNRTTIMYGLAVLLILYNLTVRDFDKAVPIDGVYDILIPFCMATISYMDNRMRYPECVENGGKLKWLGVWIRFFHIYTGYFMLNLLVKNIISPVVWREYLFMVIYVMLIQYLVIYFKRCILTILEYKLLRMAPTCTAFGKLNDNNRIALEQGYVAPEFMYGNRGTILMLIFVSIKLYVYGK